jgi:glycosyltransferase involved in cell wall biosynthesis
VQYVSYGPDCDGVRAAEEFLSRWPRLRGKRIAVSLGRIHPKKATDILIKAFAGSLAKDSDWYLVIAGPDQVGWQKELEGLASRLDIADRIIWTGMLSGAVKWGAFFASEVFVLPSHQENFGIVVAEALACGLPAIISDKINIWREIENYQAGIVGSDTVEATRASLNRWSELSDEDRDRLRSNSRRCFAEQFDYRQTSEKILQSVEILRRGNARQAESLTAVGLEDHVPSNT